MSEHGSTSPRFGRRALSAVAVLSIAATGAAWSGCGDDNNDQASSIIEQANSTAQSISDGAQQQADEAQDQANQAIDEAQGQTDTTQSQGGGYGN